MIHMIEHELIMAVATPLPRVGPAGRWLPVGPSASRPTRYRPGGAWQRVPFQGHGTYSLRLLSRPSPWRGNRLWHGLMVFDHAVVNLAPHRVQHISFLATAILFWWAVIPRSDAVADVRPHVVTMTHTGLLGALLPLAPASSTEFRPQGAPAWGLIALSSRPAISGLVMWVPAGTIYSGSLPRIHGTVDQSVRVSSRS